MVEHVQNRIFAADHPEIDESLRPEIEDLDDMSSADSGGITVDERAERHQTSDNNIGLWLEAWGNTQKTAIELNGTDQALQTVTAITAGSNVNEIQIVISTLDKEFVVLDQVEIHVMHEARCEYFDVPAGKRKVVGKFNVPQSGFVLWGHGVLDDHPNSFFLIVRCHGISNC